MRIHYVALAVLVAAAGCQQDKSKLDDIQQKPAALGPGGHGSAAPVAPSIDIDSKDILARTTPVAEADVKWVTIAWHDLDAITYHGHIDARAKTRSNADAAKLAQDIYAKLKADPSQMDAVITSTSEQPNPTTDPVTVSKSMGLPPQFSGLVDLSLRLNEGELGITHTPLGYHVILRVQPPPPDPLESADILARPATPGTVQVEHVLISWKDSPAAKRGQLDPRAKDRTKADADKLAQDILAQARGGADFAALMKKYSEDPGSKDTGKPYDVAEDSSLVPSFKKLSLRLKENEAGLVMSPFGWHIIKRVPPPPPDPLESADILKRAPVTQKAKVKHILLGWKDLNTKDPRAVNRTRAQLEALVKDTVAKLNAGAKIEDLMKSLSEDPGSAQKGDGYDVTPEAGLVAPFKDLSLRLNVGEVGVVKTDFGIHIIKRVE